MKCRWCGWFKPHPHLINPLMNPLLVFEPCVNSVVNLNANLGVQILTLSIQTLKPL